MLKVDSIVRAYLVDETNNVGYVKLNSMVNFGGHTNGFYMASLIKKNGGFQDMIDSYDNPLRFVELYNEAAKQSGDEYVFSPEFMAYLETLWSDYLATKDLK